MKFTKVKQKEYGAEITFSVSLGPHYYAFKIRNHYNDEVVVFCVKHIVKEKK